MKAKRPLEFVCFLPIETPTQQGCSYFFAAVDTFSKFLFNAGIATDKSDKSLLKHISLLIEDEQFKLHRNKGFTLVFHEPLTVEDEVKKIIKPFNGKILINENLVGKEMLPVIQKAFAISKKSFH